MRTNPRVCVEVDEVANGQDWATVIVLGTYEEFPDTPANERYRRRAHELLQKQPMWWEPGCTTTLLHARTRPTEFTYFRIRIDEISGRRCVSDAFSGRSLAANNVGAYWLRRILKRPQHDHQHIRSGSPAVSVTHRKQS